jgi:hypothetical protein
VTDRDELVSHLSSPEPVAVSVGGERDS